MKGFLTPNQIDYVLYHFSLIAEITPEIKKRFVFCKSADEISNYSDGIIFLLSNEAFNISKVKEIKGLPVLFTNSDSIAEWEISNSNLIFFQDYLKSAFYLLSGYQEYVIQAKDRLGRFDYQQSVQHQLDITNIPLVNYYFEILYQGLEFFLKRYNIQIKKKRLFSGFGFFLTHDVDRVKIYNINNFIYCSKALLGLVNRGTAFKYRLVSFFNSLTGFFKSKDPHWTFEFLREEERKYRFSSAFYFLDRLPDQINFDLTSKKIRKLIDYLEKEECEIGVHGTIESVKSKTEGQRIKEKMQSITKKTIIGNRNHTLLFELPFSIKVLKELNYKYDTTLGFADHEGFRNSFCYPFKLYDFEKDEMIDLWEVPLILMDCTLFDYRKLNFAEAYNNVERLISEIEKFGGIFTVLWHNSYFEESRYPGITQFYIGLLENIHKMEPENITGYELVKLLSNK